MAVSITIVGQGTVQLATASYDQSYSPPDSGTVYHPYGTVYTLTANPAAGWRFKRWHQPTDKSTQDGTYTHQWYPLAFDPSIPGGDSTDNPLTTNLTAPLTDVPDGRRFLLFEGNYDVNYESGSPVHYVFHDLAVTAEFELAPVGPGPILRSDAGVILRSDAGVILHQG